MKSHRPLFPTRRNRLSGKGFSLLEVVLAFAIMAVSFTMLSQLVATGYRNAREAQSLTDAQMIAQNVMEEFSLGMLSQTPVANVPVAMDNGLLTTPGTEVPEWEYSIDWEPAPVEGLVMVLVRVNRANVTQAAYYDSFELARWAPDPMLNDQMMPQAGTPGL
ncbi:MAG: prepilin-type N-terminal cleavage/methylation domain-containing protein [Pirellulaceae bacterium]